MYKNKLMEKEMQNNKSLEENTSLSIDTINYK